MYTVRHQLVETIREHDDVGDEVAAVRREYDLPAEIDDDRARETVRTALDGDPDRALDVLDWVAQSPCLDDPPQTTTARSILTSTTTHTPAPRRALTPTDRHESITTRAHCSIVTNRSPHAHTARSLRTDHHTHTSNDGSTHEPSPRFDPPHHDGPIDDGRTTERPSASRYGRFRPATPVTDQSDRPVVFHTILLGIHANYTQTVSDGES